MGIVLETPSQLVGFSPFEHDIYRSAEERSGKSDARCENGEVGLVVYGLQKCVRLALGGNPNLMSLLFTPKSGSIVYTDLISELQDLRNYFLSKETLRAFLGHSKAQRHRLEGKQGGMDVNRRQLVEHYGYDVKYAMHALRLAIQGYELYNTRVLQIPLHGNYIDLLNGVRRGHYPQKEVTQKIERYESLIREGLYNDVFPDKPNYAAIESWLLNVYKKAWYGETNV
jgi:predicted nucleotidyltransferase